MYLSAEMLTTLATTVSMFVGLASLILVLQSRNDKKFEKLDRGIGELRSEAKADIQELRTEVKADVHDLRTELKSDIRELRTELKTDIHELRTELKTDIDELRADVKTLSSDITELNVRVARFEGPEKRFLVAR